MSDILLEKISNSYWDISFDETGDFKKTDGLETAIIMSILCEKRADASDVIKPEFRRGDWSNELNDISDYEVGSKFWLLYQARANNESVNAGIEYITAGMQWMIDDKLISGVEITGEIKYRGITFTVSVTQVDNSVDTYQFEAFKATGVS